MQALAKIEAEKSDLTPEDLEKAGVPADIREEVLKQVNEKMNDVKLIWFPILRTDCVPKMKNKMEEKLESQTKDLQVGMEHLARSGLTSWFAGPYSRAREVAGWKNLRTLPFEYIWLCFVHSNECVLRDAKIAK